MLNTDKNFVYFASVQDLRGSSQVGGKFDKNDSVFKTVWDCVIVDEAHEGTTTLLGEDTVKAVLKEGNNTKLLALSGTPFNILDGYEEDAIYTWDYIMEQECKSEWDKTILVILIRMRSYQSFVYIHMILGRSCITGIILHLKIRHLISMSFSEHGQEIMKWIMPICQHTLR